MTGVSSIATSPGSRGLGEVVGLSLACAALLLAAAPLAGQEEEEEDRTIRECEQLGNANLEVGIDGIVRDEESNVPLPGATVTIRYESERGMATPEDVSVETDENGRYHACGLVAFREARVRAVYRSQRGKERRVDLDRSRFVELEVDLGDAAFLVFSVVAAESQRPVAGASITFSPLAISGVTDSLGRVALRRVPPGTYGLHVQHIAYTPLDTEINVLTDQTAEFQVQLSTRAIALAPIEVRVTGRDPYLLTSGFYDRRLSMDDGYFATYPEIDNYIHLGQVFQFKRELSIKYRRRQLILLNGRPANRLGIHLGNLRELRFSHRARDRGIPMQRRAARDPQPGPEHDDAERLQPDRHLDALTPPAPPPDPIIR